MKTYYEVLGLVKDAEDVVIRAAYRALVQKYHPDKSKLPPQDSHRIMTELNAAYGVLGNKNKRSVYDAYLQGKSKQFESEQTQTQPATEDVKHQFDEQIARAKELIDSISRNYLDEYAVLKLFEEYFKCSVSINNNWINSYTVILNGIRENLDYLELKNKLIHKISETQK
jgi:DnaJ-class molecular chaperone